MMKESLEFYNQFDKKLINDYVIGNKRIVGAIKRLGQFIPVNSKAILEIGCGLGWSSHEFAKAFTASQVLAVDLSPVLIETASKLFDGLENLTFRSYDLTQGLPNVVNDAIVMIDVYEHIPIEEREQFHKTVKALLSKNGRLLLACPSKFHQENLKMHNPSGLQPIDEDVDFYTISKIAKDIDGEVIFFEYQNIWKNYDYLYAVIERNPRYGNKPNMIKGDILHLETKDERINRVTSRLGIAFESEEHNKGLKIKALLKHIRNKLS